VKDSESLGLIRSRLVISPGIGAQDISTEDACSSEGYYGHAQAALTDALALPPCKRGCTVATPWKNSL